MWTSEREGSDDTRQQWKGGKEDDVMGEGPTQVKDRVAERDEVAHEPLIRAPRSWPSENCIRDSDPPPPLRLKVERRGGPEFPSSPLIRAR
jgi:hypothetical protein